MKQMHLYVLHHTNTHKNNNKLLLVNSKNVINQNQDNKDSQNKTLCEIIRIIMILHLGKMGTFQDW